MAATCHYRPLGGECVGELRDVMANEHGERIKLCSTCRNDRLECVQCELCDQLCVGPTFEFDEQTFCFGCAGTQIPELLVKHFKDQPEKEARVFGEYRDFFDLKEPLDFSSPETVRLWRKEKPLAPLVPGKMSLFNHELSQSAEFIPSLATYLREELIPALRKLRVDANCPVQTARMHRVFDGECAIAKFIPKARGHIRAVDLLHPRYLRKGTVISIPDMCEKEDFGAFVDFLRGK